MASINNNQSTRFHPYLTNFNQTNTKISKPIQNYTSANKPTTSANLTPKKATNTYQTSIKTYLSKINTTKFNSNDENYDYQNYLNGFSSKNSYPTLNKSNQNQTSVLRNRTNEMPNYGSSSSRKNSKKSTFNEPACEDLVETDQKEALSLKIFSVNIKMMLFFSNKIQQMKKFLLERKIPKQGLINSFMFEIIAQLDSTISESDFVGGREFSIKDQNNRLHCIFYEMDRSLERIVRDNWIRCIGKYNFKTNLFECISVRVVKSETELFAFGFLVDQTNSYLTNKYFKN